MSDAMLHVPSDVHSRWKSYCKRAGISMADGIARMLEREMAGWREPTPILIVPPQPRVALIGHVPRDIFERWVAHCIDVGETARELTTVVLERAMLLRKIERLSDAMPAVDPWALPPFWARPAPLLPVPGAAMTSVFTTTANSDHSPSTYGMGTDDLAIPAAK